MPSCPTIVMAQAQESFIPIIQHSNRGMITLRHIDESIVTIHYDFCGCIANNWHLAKGERATVAREWKPWRDWTTVSENRLRFQRCTWRRFHTSLIVQNLYFWYFLSGVARCCRDHDLSQCRISLCGFEVVFGFPTLLIRGKTWLPSRNMKSEQEMKSSRPEDIAI